MRESACMCACMWVSPCMYVCIVSMHMHSFSCILNKKLVLVITVLALTLLNEGRKNIDERFHER